MSGRYLVIETQKKWECFYKLAFHFIKNILYFGGIRKWVTKLRILRTVWLKSQ